MAVCAWRKLWERFLGPHVVLEDRLALSQYSWPCGVHWTREAVSFIHLCHHGRKVEHHFLVSSFLP